MKTQDVAKYAQGPLKGLRVVMSGIATAGPYSASMMADFGADVIHIETAKAPDTGRRTRSYEHDRRNHRNVALNVPTPEGRELFLRLIKERDIFIESSKGGQWAKWGITDQVLWEVNPALVIVHVSGFGQSGDPDYIKRASWDGVGLAFGTVMNLNGREDMPISINPSWCDCMTALYACWGALAAYYRAMETGRGDSIDISQFEVMLRGQSGAPYRFFNLGEKVSRRGNNDPLIACFKNYKCSDGYVFIGVAGVKSIKHCVEFFGMENGGELYPAGATWIDQDTEAAALLENALTEFTADKTVLEVEDRMTAMGVPCSRVMDYNDILENPHYLARDVFTEWTLQDGKKVRGVNVVPKLKNNPGTIWRPAPLWGEDNEDILSELGYNDAEIKSLYEDGVINHFQ